MMGWLTPQRELTPEEMAQAYSGGLGDVGLGTGLAASPAAPTPGIASALPASAPILANEPPPALGPTPEQQAAIAAEVERQRLMQQGAGTAPMMPVDNSIRASEEARGLAATQGLVGAEQGRDAARAQAADAQNRATEAAIDIAAVEGNVERQKADLLGANNAQQAADMSSFRADQSVLNAHANQMQRKYNYLADEAARAEMKDFWADKSTGARVLGIIAQTLSGAANGLAGQPGAPSPLDRIIERDFELQKRNLAHKVETAQTAQGALSQIYNNISSKQQAFNTMQIAMNNKVKSEISEMDALMRSDTSSARAKQAIAQIDQKNAQLDEENRQKDVQQKTSELNAVEANRVQMRGQDITANAYGNKDTKDYREIPGLEGAYHKSYNTEALKKSMGAYGATLQGLEGMRATLHDPAGYANWIKGKSIESLLRGNARITLGVGANVQGKEAADMEAIIQSFVKGKTIEQVTPQLVDQMIDALESSTGYSMRGTLGQVPGAHYKENDPIYGRAFQLSRPRAAPPVPAQ